MRALSFIVLKCKSCTCTEDNCSVYGASQYDEHMTDQIFQLEHSSFVFCHLFGEFECLNQFGI